jgi:hypothetical protein
VIDVEIGTDLIHLTYPPGKVTAGQVLAVIRKQGFEGAIVPEKPAPRPKGE